MTRQELWEQTDADLYRVLGVPADADAASIQAAWRDAAKRTHPDLGGSHSQFRAVHVAYLVLSDPDSRARYDRTRATRMPPPRDDEVPRVVAAPIAKRKHLMWLAIVAGLVAVGLSWMWPVFTIVAAIICTVIVSVGYVRLDRRHHHWR